MSELDRLANELEAEQLTSEDLDNIIKMVRSRLSGYDMGNLKVKTSEAEDVNIFDVIKVAPPKVNIVRRKI